MARKSEASSRAPNVWRDFDLDAVSLGPATRLIVLETDPEGGVYYQFGRRKPQSLQLPREWGLTPLVVMDLVSAATILDPKTHRLKALAVFTQNGTQMVLFGSHWGKWIGDDGKIQQARSPRALVQQLQAPYIVLEEKNLVGFDFLVNVHNFDAFHPEVLATFREGKVYHTLKMLFDFPTGEYQQAWIDVQDSDTHKLLYVFDLNEFPLIVPRLRRQAKPKPKPVPEPKTKAAPKVSQKATPTPKRDWSVCPKKARTERASTPSPAVQSKPASRPLPKTDHLPVHELISVLSTERSSDRRWQIIEANLMLTRPERTYALILNYLDPIAERSVVWPPGRLRAIFANQPGAVLIGIMSRWHVNQVLAVAEENAESDRILEWLREREIERLLQSKLAEPTSVEAARTILGVDRLADTAAIRRTWRVLLGFINADVGRSQERAIHRRKDEIAKYLQMARNLLLKITY